MMELPPPPDWTLDGNCVRFEGETFTYPWDHRSKEVTVTPDLFYPQRGGTARPAKLICEFCPVKQECLDYAIENGEKHGVWGGLSERERRRLRKERAA